MQTAIAPKVQKIKDQRFPQFLFEWHEGIGKVYVIALPGRFQDEVFVPGMIGEAKAQVLAEHCDHHARFIGFVQSYTRGYLQGTADVQLKAKSKGLKP